MRQSEGLAVGAEYVDDFVLVQLCHQVACGTAVFARVELTGFLGKDFAHGSGEGQTRVGVDIDFSDSRLGSFAELFLGNTHCIRQFASVGVDDVHILLRHRR